MKTERLLKILSLSLCFSLTLFSSLYLFIGGMRPTKTEGKTVVLRLWHVETFEGGKGSRSAFIKKVAKTVEQTENVLIHVDTFSSEGIELALRTGTPDLISFGRGAISLPPSASSLPYRFSGGEIGGKTYAYPWCVGQYFLFSKTADFSSANQKNTLLSNGNSLTAVSALYGGFSGEMPVDTATSAYVRFLNGDYPYLLGTQRDEMRFISRGESVQKQPLTAFNDLFQCICVTSLNHREESFALVKELLSPEVQESLSSIGMYPYSATQAERCLPVFFERENFNAVQEHSFSALLSGDRNFLENCVKALN